MLNRARSSVFRSFKLHKSKSGGPKKDSIDYTFETCIFAGSSTSYAADYRAGAGWSVISTGALTSSVARYHYYSRWWSSMDRLFAQLIVFVGCDSLRV